MSGAITIVGLGPGDPGQRTLATQRALDHASRIILRTGVHPGVANLLADPRVTTCDDLYETIPTFEALYAAIAGRVVAAAAAGDVVLAVPGHPLFGEHAVRLILAQAKETELPVTVLDAVSVVDAVARALAVDPLADQVQLLDAAELAAIARHDPYAGGLLDIAPVRPCLVTQVYSPAVASATKLALARLFPEDHEIVVVVAAGVPGAQRLLRCPLYALDRQPVDHLTSAWVPALPPLEAYRSPATLQRIVARLRAPGGCPWDREQTAASLRHAVIEEAHEVVDAIEAGDAENLVEELGDLLLLVAMQAQIAEEAGDFALEDAVEHVTRKLIRRHPHVFGDVVARTPGEVIQTWDGVKAAERQARGIKETARPSHPLDRLPRSMPALQRVASVLRDEQRNSGVPSTGQDEAVIGDALLSAVATAVAADINPESALIAALRRRDRVAVPNAPETNDEEWINT